MRRLTFAIAILIAGAAPVTAQGVPNFNIDQGCLQVSSGPNKLTTFDQCMDDENDARDYLMKNWQSFLPSEQRVCLAETISDGSPSYVELLECLNVAKDTRTKTERGRQRNN